MAFGDVLDILLGLDPAAACACLAVGAAFSAVALAKCSRKRGPRRRRRGFRAFVAFEARIILPALRFLYLWAASSAVLAAATAYLLATVPALAGGSSALSAAADLAALLVCLALAEVALRVVFEALYLSAKAHETLASYKHPYSFEGGEEWVVPPSEASCDDLGAEGSPRRRPGRARSGRRAPADGGASAAAAPASVASSPAPAVPVAPAPGPAAPTTAPANAAAPVPEAEAPRGPETAGPEAGALPVDAFSAPVPDAPSEPRPSAPPAAAWDCACGSRGNAGAFCGNCGAPRPAR